MPFVDLRSVRIGRGARERLGGRATLVLELRDGRVISIAAVAQLGVVHELAERLRAATAG